MVGVGTTFPHCMQHQIANITGSLDGTTPLDLGAVVNGPNGADLFSDGIGGFQDGTRRRPLLADRRTRSGHDRSHDHGRRRSDRDDPLSPTQGAYVTERW